MPKAYFYESDRFMLYRDGESESMLDEAHFLDVPQGLLDEYEKAKKEFDAVQKKLYNIRKEQKGF
jgi:hypothetical protein